MKRLGEYKFKKKVDKKLCDTEWQEFAKKIVEDFKIKKGWPRQKIFQLARDNNAYLKAKIDNLIYKSEKERKPLSSYAGLLIYIITNRK